MLNSSPNIKLDYLTRDFVQDECQIFGAIFNDDDCDLIIAEAHHLYSQGNFHHTGVYWIANDLTARNLISPQYIDFDSAEYAINQDGSFLAQKGGLWGLFDDFEPEVPIAPCTFKTRDELISWYFDDMGWNLYHHITLDP